MILQSVNAPTAGPTLPLTGQASAGSHTCPLTRQQPGSSPVNLVAASQQAKTWPVASKAQDTTPLTTTALPLHAYTHRRSKGGGPSQTALRDWTATLAIHALQSVRVTDWFSRSTALLKFTIHEPIAAPLQGTQLALVGSLLKGWALDRNALAVRRYPPGGDKPPPETY